MSLAPTGSGKLPGRVFYNVVRGNGVEPPAAEDEMKEQRAASRTLHVTRAAAGEEIS